MFKGDFPWPVHVWYSPHTLSGVDSILIGPPRYRAAGNGAVCHDRGDSGFPGAGEHRHCLRRGRRDGMKLLRICIGAWALLSPFATSARATTVLSTAFPALVHEAALVVAGTAQAIEAEWNEATETP